MTSSDDAVLSRAERYARQRGLTLLGRLGYGMDGSVWATSGKSAVKSFERPHQYRTERDAYLRLREDGVREILGHAVPRLWEHDDDLWVIEMDIVRPPYLLDFAKTTLDVPPDFPEEVMAERRQHWAETFGERWADVVAIMRVMERRHGIYLLDPTPRNITF